MFDLDDGLGTGEVPISRARSPPTAEKPSIKLKHAAPKKPLLPASVLCPPSTSYLEALGHVGQVQDHGAQSETSYTQAETGPITNASADDDEFFDLNGSNGEDGKSLLKPSCSRQEGCFTPPWDMPPMRVGSASGKDFFDHSSGSPLADMPHLNPVGVIGDATVTPPPRRADHPHSPVPYGDAGDTRTEFSSPTFASPSHLVRAPSSLLVLSPLRPTEDPLDAGFGQLLAEMVGDSDIILLSD